MRSFPSARSLAPRNLVAIALLVGATLPLACAGDDGTSASGASLITSASGGTNPTTASASDTAATESESESASASDSGLTSGDATTTSSSDSASDSDTTTTDMESTTTGTTSDSDPTTTTGDATTDASEPEPCQIEETAIVPVPSDILFVLDKSGSMSMELWDHDDDIKTPNITRWKSLYNVVEAVVTTFDHQLNFGAKLYPKIDAGSYINQGACEITPGVEVPIAPNNALALLEGIPGPDVMVLGGTPSYRALDQGFKYLYALMTGLEAAVIFITDGEISCDDPPAAAIAVISQAWNSHGIPTYVVGIDVDAKTSSQLNQFALAGGKPINDGNYKFYQALDQIELQAAMQSILDDTISCLLPIDPVPNEPELFEVWIDGEKIAPITDCDQESGWRWVVEHNEIEVCGAACTALKQGEGVEARYFCLPR